MCGAPARISYGDAFELGLVANKDLRDLMAFPKGCPNSCEVANPLYIPDCLNKSGNVLDFRVRKGRGGVKRNKEKDKLRKLLLQEEELSPNARNVWFVYDEQKFSDRNYGCEANYQCHRQSDCKWNYYCNLLFEQNF